MSNNLLELQQTLGQLCRALSDVNSAKDSYIAAFSESGSDTEGLKQFHAAVRNIAAAIDATTKQIRGQLE